MIDTTKSVTGGKGQRTKSLFVSSVDLSKYFWNFSEWRDLIAQLLYKIDGL